MVVNRPGFGGLVRHVPSTAAPSEAHRRFLVLASEELDRLYRLAGLLLGSGPEAQDAVGDALERGWQSADSLRNGGDFQAWLDRILVNVCRDRLRRRSHIRFIALAAYHDRSGQVDPYQALAERDALTEAVARLPPDERMVVVLHFWHDLTLAATAERLNWPVGTVKSRLNRALGRIREGLVQGELRL